MDKRSNWVDYGKGLGIILMVYAHLLSSAFHAGIEVPKRFFELSDSIIYGFHMPFFFFLSGLFVEGSLKKRGVREYLRDKFLRIFYPYLLWSLIQVSVEVIFSSHTQQGAEWADLLAILYRPWGQFWFLYALLWMHITYAAFSYLGKYAAPAMFALGLVFFFFPLPFNVFSLSSFSAKLVFFAGGVLFQPMAMKADVTQQRWWVVLLMLAALFASGYFIFETLIPPMRLSSKAYPFYFLYLSMLGIISFSALSQTLAKKRLLPILQTLGRYSLQIYLVHMLAGVAARMILLMAFGVTNWVAQIIIGTLAALAAPIFLQRLSDQFNFPYFFELRKRHPQG